jgi:hypothetical protein
MVAAFQRQNGGREDSPINESIKALSQQLVSDNAITAVRSRGDGSGQARGTLNATGLATENKVMARKRS